MMWALPCCSTSRASNVRVGQLAYGGRIAAFVGRCAAAFAHAFWRRGTIRWNEVLEVATEAGANAVPIVLLVGGLMGLIVAFEIGLVAQQFGAVIFVVNGVGVAMLRSEERRVGK